MAPRVERTVVLILFILLAAFPCFAQTSRGTISGQVSDPHTAAVSGVTVDLTALDTNFTRSGVTNAAGLYRFDAVDSGDYKLTFRGAGFRTLTIPRFRVGAAELVRQDARLEVGDLLQAIEVTAQVTQLQTEAPVRGGNLEGEQVQLLPYASRNPVGLGLLLPGVAANKYMVPTTSYIVNGTRGRSNNYMIDGTDNNDLGVTGQAIELRNPDAVKEVSVQTINYDAEFGRAGGAVVNLITRSGTNQLHGSAGFVLDSTRDDALTSSLSRDPAIRARGRLLPGTEQQFDGTLGGPIRKDRAFYHVSYFEDRQFSTSTSDVISLSAEGRATLAALFPAGTNANADLLRQITAGYDATTLLSSVSAGLGRPNIQIGHALTPYSQKMRIRQIIGKTDHYLSSRDFLTARFLLDDTVTPHGIDSTVFPSFNTSATGRTSGFSLYHTHTFSPLATNELRIGFSRNNFNFALDPTNPLGKTLPQISLSGIGISYGVKSMFPQGRLANNYAFEDTVSIIARQHILRFGVDLLDQRARQSAPFNSRGTLSYGNGTSAQTDTALANFLDDFGGSGGVSRAFGSALYYPSFFRQTYFFQDRWRAAASLTLTLGMRYEYFGTPMNAIFNPVYTGLFTVNPVTGESPLTQHHEVTPDKNNWAPVAGLAWSPAYEHGLLSKIAGQRKSVFRVGYRLGYDSYFNQITSLMVASAPANVATTIISSPTTQAPRGLANLSSILPTTPPPIGPGLTQSSVYQNLVNPYYQSWNAGVQRSLPAGVLLDLAYVGTKGTRLYMSEDGNPTVPLDLQGPVPSPLPPGTSPAGRLDPLQGARTVRTNGGSSIYHAAQVEVRRKFSGGFGLTASYTFSKVIDNGSDILGFGNSVQLNGTGVPSFFGGLQMDRAVGSFDHPQRLVFTYTYELPFYQSQRGLAGHLAGGWVLAGVTTYETGSPYTVVNGVDGDGLAGASFDRPDVNPSGPAGVRAVPKAGSPGVYLNPDNGNAPIDPSQARYIALPANNGLKRTPSGTLGRNTERQPGLKNWDLNIVKNIKLAEQVRLEIRGEFYNVFNTPMYGKTSVSPFAVSQSNAIIPSNVTSAPAGNFLNPTVMDGGGRVIRYQIRLRF